MCPSDGHMLNVLREWRPGENATEKYRITEKIGHGSMGPVFRAKVLPYGGIRVLKPLASNLADDEAVLEAFQRTIQATNRLRHKHVVHIESFERTTDGRPFIVMEYSPGLTLRELMLGGRSMEASYIQEIAAQICSALEFGHNLGIIHRNLKPENISIMEEHDGTPWVKVMEFGLAAVREAAAEHDKPIGDVEMTRYGPVVGLREYISPEQAAGTPGGMLDGRTDVYSLGAVIFEALTGDLPDITNDLSARLLQLHDAAKNEKLFTIVLRALQNNPSDRYPSAAAMAADLREIPSTAPRASGRATSSGAEKDQGEVGMIGNAPEKPAAPIAPDRVPAAIGGRSPASPKVGSDPYRTEPGKSPAPMRPPRPTDVDLDDLRRSWGNAAAGSQASRGKKSWARVGAILGLALGLGFGGSWVAYQWFHLSAPPQVALPESHEGTAPRLVAPKTQPLLIQDAETNQGFAAPVASQPRDRLQTGTARRKSSRLQKVEGSTTGGNLDHGSPQPAGAPTPQAVAQEAALKERITAGWASMERKDYRAASENFAEALKIDPSSVEAQAALRLARYALQHPDVEVLPSNPPASNEGSVKRPQ